MKKKIIILSIISTTLLVIAMAYFFHRFYMPNVSIKNADVAYIYIRDNADYEEVLDSLEQYLINPSSFNQLAKIKKYPHLIKSGRFEIQNDWSNNELINYLRLGNQSEVKLVLNNVSSIEELSGKIASQIEADSTSIINYIYSKDFLRESRLNKKTILSLFIPNTYFFYWNTDAETFCNRMLKEYNKFWDKTRLKKCKEIGLSPVEVSILASIVQKETVQVSERQLVAGLYMNRLNNNWRLESDPTVIYALKKKYKFKKVIRRVLKKDTKIKSPYNTYKNIGLPPGPITIPDINSIDAVLNYIKHPFFFMCASVDNIGYHKFSKGLRAHNINARKYQKWLDKKNIKR